MKTGGKRELFFQTLRMTAQEVLGIYERFFENAAAANIKLPSAESGDIGEQQEAIALNQAYWNLRAELVDRSQMFAGTRSLSEISLFLRQTRMPRGAPSKTTIKGAAVALLGIEKDATRFVWVPSRRALRAGEPVEMMKNHYHEAFIHFLTAAIDVYESFPSEQLRESARHSAYQAFQTFQLQ